jgi:coenzyme PQQ precursor peptide PqqA
MKVWKKPAAATVDAGFEVTRYLPSELDVKARRFCAR